MRTRKKVAVTTTRITGMACSKRLKINLNMASLVGALVCSVPGACGRQLSYPMRGQTPPKLDRAAVDGNHPALSQQHTCSRNLHDQSQCDVPQRRRRPFRRSEER